MQQTRRLYDEDSTRRSFCATVLACESTKDGFCAALDATAFYPEGGGQPADRGALGGARVLDVHEREGVVWHTLTAPLHVGDLVQGDVDWARRSEMMQQHTGEHIVSGIVHAQFGWDNVGFHIGEDAVTVDFSGPLTAAELAQVEGAANAAVWKNLPVTVEVPSPEKLAQMTYRSKKELTGPVRIVTIGTPGPGAVDVCACCGTHVRATGQVGEIKLLDAQSYKGGVRVTMACGIRALRDHVQKQESVRAVSVLLSAKPDAVDAAVERLQAENAALHARAAALENELFARRAAEFAGAEKAVCFADDLSPDSLRRLCLALCAAAKPGAVCAAFSRAGEGFAYALGACEGDVRAVGKAMNAALSGRGGGKPGLVQGSVACSEEAVRAFFAAL